MGTRVFCVSTSKSLCGQKQLYFLHSSVNQWAAPKEQTRAKIQHARKPVCLPCTGSLLEQKYMFEQLLINHFPITSIVFPFLFFQVSKRQTHFR